MPKSLAKPEAKQQRSLVGLQRQDLALAVAMARHGTVTFSHPWSLKKFCLVRGGTLAILVNMSSEKTRNASKENLQRGLEIFFNAANVIHRNKIMNKKIIGLAVLVVLGFASCHQFMKPKQTEEFNSTSHRIASRSITKRLFQSIDSFKLQGALSPGNSTGR